MKENLCIALMNTQVLGYTSKTRDVLNYLKRIIIYTVFKIHIL